MAWTAVNPHSTGQISSGEPLFDISEGQANPSYFYKLKAYKMAGFSKPVLALNDTRNGSGYIFKSAEFFNNIKPANQIDGLSLFASQNDIGGLDNQPVSNTQTGALNLWMDANGILTATAPATGSTTIPIPTGGNLVITVQPQYGTVAIVNGDIVYSASNGYSGADSLTYELRGASGNVIGSPETLLFSTSAASATPVPVFDKIYIDENGDIKVKCLAGSTVTLYKNGDTNIVGTLPDSTNLGYVLFPNIPRVQSDFFKAKAQKSGLTLSGFSVKCTTKKKPSLLSGVTKQVAAGGSVTISIAELVADSENATFF
jgi:hypothetical protein